MERKIKRTRRKTMRIHTQKNKDKDIQKVIGIKRVMIKLKTSRLMEKNLQHDNNKGILILR